MTKINKKMTAPLTYPQSIEVISKAVDSKLTFLEAFVEQAQQFIKSNKQFLATLAKIDRDVPYKRATGFKSLANNLLSTSSVAIPGPVDKFNDFEKHFIEIIEKMSLSIFSVPPGLDVEIELFQTNFVEHLNFVVMEYKKQTGMLFANIKKEKKAYKALVDKYEASKQKYQQLISQIESNYAKMQQTPDDEKLRDKKTKQIDELNVFIRGHKELYTETQEAEINWGKSMESFLSTFEMLEEKLHEDIQGIYQEFAILCESIKNKKECAQAFLGGIIKQETLDSQLDEALSQSKAHPAQSIPADLNITKLQFDISPILGNEIFQTEMEKEIGEIYEDYTARMPDEITLKKGTLVNVVNMDNNNRYLVQAGNEMGYVLRDAVILLPKYNQHTCFIAQSFNTGNVHLDPGANVLVKNKKEGIAVVTTMDFQDLEIPAEYVN